MKYLNHTYLLILIVSIIGAIFVFTQNKKEVPTEIACTMDALICPDGTAVGRTGPNCSFAPCPSVPPVTSIDDIQAHINSKSDLIIVESPTRGSVISTPVTITGKARGYWFFEASFPITIVDWNGLIIGEGIATAQDEWMTENFVPFKATINFTLPPETPYRRGAIILQKDNPSGLPENDNALEIPITF